MAGEDHGHLALLRATRCAVGVECEGHIEPHHSTAHRFGKSQRSHDHAAMPLCSKHHREFHGAFGHFRDWGHVARDEWEMAMVEVYRPKDAPDVF